MLVGKLVDQSEVAGLLGGDQFLAEARVNGCKWPSAVG